jgi:hypothetical protein
VKRVLALLAAVAMIVVAIVVRGAIDDDSGGSGNPDGRTTALVVCAEEVRAACDALGFGARFQVTVEDAADTAARLANATEGPDAWVVPAPWPAIVDEARIRAGRSALFDEASDALASTRIAAVGPDDLADCNWSCLGERAANDLKIGSRPLAASGLGVLTVGAAAAGFLGSPDFATNDLDATFDRWLNGFADGIEPSPGPVLQLLQSRAFFDVALTYEAEAAPALAAASADRKAGLALLYPAPVALLDVVIAVGSGASSSDVDDLESSLRDALIDTGWSAPSGAASGLPSPGVLTALRDRIR